MHRPEEQSVLLRAARLDLAPRSVVVADGVEYGLARLADGDWRLAVLAATPEELHGFAGERSQHEGHALLVGPCHAANAAALRARLAWLQPRVLGLQPSAGLGDRLGLATPGHVRAVRAVGGGIAPIFAQQSIREMQRTGRTPQQVMDDATWGVFAEGWRDGFGADADHLKTLEDVEQCVAAGYTFYTVDPGAYVDDRAASADPPELERLFAALPWDALEDRPADLLRRYADLRLELEGHRVALDQVAARRAAVKYGRAVAHVARMYRHLLAVAGDRPVELEVSVDETTYPTSHAEHVYLASELQRLGVRWVSLAPRYVGRFEKGVDYVGDLAAFEADFAAHAAIARQFGPYKLSLHSGSDKFSIYPIVARQSRGLAHLKTAGTSYLEALRAIAHLEPALFRAIYAFARQQYPTDRASYHVSAELERAPQPEELDDAGLPTLLEHFHAREILHVTFGSVLTARTSTGELRFGARLMQVLQRHPEEYARHLETHFVRHLQPFAAVLHHARQGASGS
ncbi:tagaturonate epimerase family protein [Kallotenue papyrolyticum]|uniref:tagaturonate epimerase family protein n=1 Tax=Kallotenue papyrolyticum TaxID=1325125 RepID=UPI0004785819|nr:tagaturonate epimerase family protein [Kallotenue papyrolyticum]